MRWLVGLEPDFDHRMTAPRHELMMRELFEDSGYRSRASLS